MCKGAAIVGILMIMALAASHTADAIDKEPVKKVSYDWIVEVR